MKLRSDFRAGITLIELLVAMSIIAILGALLTVGIRGWINAQARRNTEASMRALTQALREHWKAVVEEARKEVLPVSDPSIKKFVYDQKMIPDNPNPNPENLNPGTFPRDVKKFAGGDEERARIIWIKLRLMEAFPVNFTEIARAYTNDPVDPKKNYPNPLVLIPRDRRKNMAGYSSALASRIKAKTLPKTESGACLLLALSANHGGVSHSGDFLRPYTADSDGDGISELVDGFGEALRFYRFATQNDDLQKHGKTLPAGANPVVAGESYYDPLDPKGRLCRNTSAPTVHWNNSNATQFFDLKVHKRLVTAPTTAASPVEPWHAVPVLASSGPDTILGLIPNTLTAQEVSPDTTEYTPQTGSEPYQNMRALKEKNDAGPGKNRYEADNTYSYQLK